MDAERSSVKLIWLSLAGLALAAMAGAAVLYFFDPATVAIYPVCYFYRFTGLQCPGCGGLRAAHQLLHGQVAAAWRLNAFVVLAAPAFAWLCARFLVRRLKGQPADFNIPSRWLWTALGILFAFGVLRNVIR